MPCRHQDIQVFDDFKCCLSCGELVPESSIYDNLDLPYKYTELNYSSGHQIRLCILLPGHSTEDIKVDLLHVNIDDKPPFEALSYAWATEDGDDSLSQTVTCQKRTIPVTKTCEAALRRLRRQNRKRHIWVDAICIDQGNIQERSHQVGFMSTIFATASQVVIYLGVGNNSTDKVLDYLNETDDGGARVRRPGFSIDVKNFLKHRWLDRVWVLQEIALARLAVLIAGDKTTQWTMESINKLLNLCKIMSIEPPSVLRWLPASEPDPDFLSVLHNSRNCSSTDPRDKVFAVLGLADQEFRDVFKADYSLSTEEVYTKLAVHFVEPEGDLRILKYSTGQSKELQARLMPSWIPQWDIKNGYDPLPAQFDQCELEFMRSVWSTTMTQSDILALPQSQELLHEFLSFFPVRHQVKSTSSWRRLFARWLKGMAANLKGPDSAIILESAALYLTQMHASDFHFTIEHAEQTPDHRSSVKSEETVSTLTSPQPDAWPRLRIRAHHLDTIKVVAGIRSGDRVSYISRFHAEVSDKPGVCDPCDKHFVATPLCQHTPSVASTISEEFNRDMSRALVSAKTLFYTNRSVGVARARMLPHDSIWALDGADVPFILRKVGDHYTLVAECFLYRALRHTLCICCGCELEAWPIVTQIIDIL